MNTDRPSKKQRELLSFIDGFIKGNGYGPSYREVMRALNYKSVSTVAVHIDGLIAKGHLVKHGRSARSLEVVGGASDKPDKAASDKVHLSWLRQKSRTYRADGDTESAELLEKAIQILDQTGEKR